MPYIDQDQRKDKIKKDTNEGTYAIYEGQEWTLSAFKSKIFPIKLTQGKWLKILTLKQMPPRLPISLAQVKVGHVSGNLLNHYILYIKQKKLLKKSIAI